MENMGIHHSIYVLKLQYAVAKIYHVSSFIISVFITIRDNRYEQAQNFEIDIFCRYNSVQSIVLSWFAMLIASGINEYVFN